MADSSDRVAELKKKMQEAAAKRAQEQAAASGADAAPASVASAPAVSEPVASAPVASAPTAAEIPAASSSAEAVAVIEAAGSAPAGTDVSGVQPVADSLAQAEVANVDSAAPAAVAEAPVDLVVAPVMDAVAPTGVETAPIAAVPAAAAPSVNGTSAQGDAALPTGMSKEDIEKREMTRRELLTYAWGGALVLVGGAVGLGLYGFMYPRFRAGEFGGDFFVPVSELPAVDAGPNPFPAGKFWLVQQEGVGAKALYMVCTHLGCLYKWEASNFRFECPCHGSKFSKDGYYIEGPAPRSLDTFATTQEGDIITVDTGAKTTGAPSNESPDSAV